MREALEVLELVVVIDVVVIDVALTEKGRVFWGRAGSDAVAMRAPGSGNAADRRRPRAIRAYSDLARPGGRG